MPNKKVNKTSVRSVSKKISKSFIKQQLKKAKAIINQPALKPYPNNQVLDSLNRSGQKFVPLGPESDSDFYTPYCGSEQIVIGATTHDFDDANNVCIQHHLQTGHNAFPVGSSD